MLRFMAEACTLLKSVPVKSDQGNAVGNYVVDCNMYSLLLKMASVCRVVMSVLALHLSV